MRAAPGYAICSRKGTSTTDQIINLVAERAGISQDQARTAVTTVLGFVKDKLPAPLASHVDALLTGQSSSGDLAGEAQQLLGNLGGLGGLFGHKSE